jgi:thiamine pyrophosphokinase
LKAAVVAHGRVDDYDYIRSFLADCDMIVCADGGAEHVLACNLMPDAVIGDLDSISSSLLEKLEKCNCKIVRYPREKDFTDTQLAVNYALANGADEIILLGCIGERLDHSMANIFLLVKLLRAGIRHVNIVNEKNSIYITDGIISLKGSIGDTVSLIPIGGSIKGIYTRGLKYPLKGETIELGNSLGISNVFTEPEVEIKFEEGYLLVFKSRD